MPAIPDVLSRFSRRRRTFAAISLTAIFALVLVGIVAAGGSSDTPGAGAEALVDEVVSTTSTTSGTSTTSAVPATTTSTTGSTSTIAPTTTSTDSTINTIVDQHDALDPGRLPTLVEGMIGDEIAALQRMLNIVTGATLPADGVYGQSTTEAVTNFQAFMGMPATGHADHDTRLLLFYMDNGRSNTLPNWPIPTIGNGGADGCQVTVIGDSLMAGAMRQQEQRLGDLGCASAADAVGGRSLAVGWQCRIRRPDGSLPLLLLAEPEPGNDTCAPSGLTLLRMWADAEALGDLVVIALGTNDAGLATEARWIEHWQQALAVTGERPVVFLTTRARPDSAQTAKQDTYSDALRRFCITQPRCVLAEWAFTAAALDPASYIDQVHLTGPATAARSAFIRDVVGALISGRPIPNPRPVPTPIVTLPTTTTTTTTTTPTTTTPITTTPTTPETTVAPTSTTTTTTTTPPATTAAPTTTTMTTAPTTTSTTAPT